MRVVFKHLLCHKLSCDKSLLTKRNIFLSFIAENNEQGKRENEEGQEGENKETQK